MEWKEIKDGKPVEEGVEKAPEEKPEVAENATEVKPEVKAQEPVEQKAEAPAEDKLAEAEAKAPEDKTAEKEEKTPEEKAAEKKANRAKRLEIGAFKLNRSGDCEITYLGKKSKGTWKQSDSGNIVIKYGEDKKIVAKISTKTGVMKAKDNESMVYKLEK